MRPIVSSKTTQVSDKALQSEAQSLVSTSESTRERQIHTAKCLKCPPTLLQNFYLLSQHTGEAG